MTNKSLMAFVVFLFLALVARAEETIFSALEAESERNYKAAIQILTNLSKKEEGRDVLFYLARAQYLSGHYSSASKVLERLHQNYSADGEALYLSGLVHLALVNEVNIFKKVGMANKALKSWESSVAADPKNIDSRYAIFAYYAKAPKIAGGNLEVARELMIQINEFDAGYGAMAAGQLFSKEGDYARAETAFQKATVLMNRAGPYFSLGQFYMQTEQYNKVLTSVEKFLHLEKRWWDVDVTGAYLMMAKANAELGNIEEARRMAYQGLKKNPNKQIKRRLEATLKSL